MLTLFLCLAECALTQGGFGSVDGEFWLGLEPIYQLGRQGDYKLMVELEDWMNKKVYAQYSSFHLEPESQGFRLRLGTYQGNAGDSLSSHNGKQFTTLDRDKDAFIGRCILQRLQLQTPTTTVSWLLLQETVHISTKEAGGTTPVARPTSTASGTQEACTAANSRTGFSGPTTAAVSTP